MKQSVSMDGLEVVNDLPFLVIFDNYYNGLGSPQKFTWLYNFLFNQFRYICCYELFILLLYHNGTK